MSAPLATGLVRYDAMCNAIAACVQVDEVKEIRDKARAMEVYAAQALNTDAERKAREVRIRAERRTGELLKEMKATGQRQNKGGDRKSKSNGATLINGSPKGSPKSNGSTSGAKLSDLGISKTQSSDWQKLAEIPEQEFEEQISDPHVSTEGLLQRHSPSPPLDTPRIDVTALQAWGRICDFERYKLIDRPLPELFDLMTPSMQDDLIRATPVLIAWFEHFMESQRSRRKRA